MPLNAVLKHSRISETWEQFLSDATPYAINDLYKTQWKMSSGLST